MSIIEAIRKARHRVITKSGIEPDLVVCDVITHRELREEIKALCGYCPIKGFELDGMLVVLNEYMPDNTIAVTKAINLELPDEY